MDFSKWAGAPNRDTNSDRDTEQKSFMCQTSAGGWLCVGNERMRLVIYLSILLVPVKHLQCARHSAHCGDSRRTVHPIGSLLPVLGGRQGVKRMFINNMAYG